MSSGPGMCPQRLFTNTKLFTIAGKRNPTRARSGPDLAGGAGPSTAGREALAQILSGGAAVRPGRGAAGPARSAGTTAAPPLSSRRRRARAAVVLGPEGTRRPQLFSGDASRPPQPLLLPISPPTPLSCLQPGSGKTPSATAIHIKS